MTPEEQAKLREPFPAHMIGKLPRGGKQLDFVGHAAVTDRLLAVDPEWSWEPLGLDEYGAPLVRVEDNRMVMWARLTVCGVTRPCVGIVLPNKAEPEKELISDMLRNGAMRFGVALDLWSKEDLLETEQSRSEYSQIQRAGAARGPETEPTSKGNTRRGPRVLEGWADIDEQRDAHDAYKQAALDSLDDAKRATLKAAHPEWPMTASQMVDAVGMLEDLAAQMRLDLIEAEGATL